MSSKAAKWIAAAFANIFLACLGVWLSGEVLIRATPLPDLSRTDQFSQIVVASSGELLWTFLTPDGKWRLKTQPREIDERYSRLLLAYEDRRFHQHPGVDIFALFRACFQAVASRRSVSGASTITMQVVRMLEPRPRNLSAKIEQIIKAVRLERFMSKDEILRTYMTLAPFGGNIEGVRAASLIYFGKEPRTLTLAESALLVALPQLPEARRPDRQVAAARAARDHVFLPRRRVMHSI
jgi:penicillin-binding protein 1C